MEITCLIITICLNYIDDFLSTCKDNFSKYGKDAESVMYATATKKAMKKEELDEMSSMGGGAVQGYAGEKEEIEEMYY